jgi:hypothetical protein
MIQGARAVQALRTASPTPLRGVMAKRAINWHTLFFVPGLAARLFEAALDHTSSRVRGQGDSPASWRRPTRRARKRGHGRCASMRWACWRAARRSIVELQAQGAKKPPNS